ncbi:MAG TPA: MOSC domain-containing protein [Dehalococcoidia bacterium]|nr:MOSC domain-containing protein [Dehalococcoidia bacterium]
MVEAVCLSRPGVRVAKQPCDEAFLGPHGFVGDRHEAEFRANRFGGPPRKNPRQWSAVSSDEVAELCADLGLDRPFQPGALGENLLLSGVQLAFVPEESVIEFPGGARLLVNGRNDPCVNAAAELSQTYGPSIRERFIKTAFGRRGIIGSVLESGVIRPGERVRILVPEPAGRARI